MKEHLLALEHSRSQALVQGDWALAERLHAAHYQLITPAGRTYRKLQYLQALQDRDVQYLRWDCGPMQILLGDKLAVLRYIATLQFATPTGPGVPFDCWHTDVYENQGEAWQAVWSQATLITSKAL